MPHLITKVLYCDNLLYYLLTKMSCDFIEGDKKIHKYAREGKNNAREAKIYFFINFIDKHITFF